LHYAIFKNEILKIKRATIVHLYYFIFIDTHMLYVPFIASYVLSLPSYSQIVFYSNQREFRIFQICQNWTLLTFIYLLIFLFLFHVLKDNFDRNKFFSDICLFSFSTLHMPSCGLFVSRNSVDKSVVSLTEDALLMVISPWLKFWGHK
jgi:hypothetical protein